MPINIFATDLLALGGEVKQLQKELESTDPESATFRSSLEISLFIIITLHDSLTRISIQQRSRGED